MLIGAEVWSSSASYVPFIAPAAGFAACLGVPMALAYFALGRFTWRWKSERLVVALAGALLVLIGTGLVLNTLLPLLGVDRPLDQLPVFLGLDLVDLVLGVVAYRYMPATWWFHRVSRLDRTSASTTALALLAIPLSAMGAVRLNNGAGDQLSLVAIVLILAAMTGLTLRAGRFSPGLASICIYAVSLALLFMTSLRGWYTTGHDVQHEMLVFLGTDYAGKWSPNPHDGYFSCLSITILPTIFERFARVASPYIFKVFFQMVYAACPVIVFHFSRRISTMALGVISTFLFVGFVGFSGDMPMLNRQEIGFVFFSAAMLLLFMTEQTRPWRWCLFSVMAVGMVLSHYSTAYFASAALLGALLLREAFVRLLPAMPATWQGRVGTARSRDLIGWPIVLLLLGMTYVWNGPINGSGGAVISQVSSAFRSVGGHTSSRAAETGYSIAGPGRGISRSQALRDLFTSEAEVRVSHPQSFIPSQPPSEKLTPLSAEPVLPLTSVGRVLLGSESRANALNRIWRSAAATGLQLLIGIGLVVVLIRKWKGIPFRSDALYLSLALLLILIAQVALPGISLDYGIGRSFMQALIVLGSVMAIGLDGLFGVVMNRWRLLPTFAVAAGMYVSTSGLVPQLTGGYAPQLQLNNAGDYYDEYYLTPQLVSELQWLQNSVITPRLYPDIQADGDVFNEARSLGGIRAYSDIYPSAVRKDAYVVLGPNEVRFDRFPVTSDGYEFWLLYPTTVIQNSKSLVYDNGQTRVYR
jgi:uncharacterized membrane protein